MIKLKITALPRMYVGRLNAVRESRRWMYRGSPKDWKQTDGIKGLARHAPASSISKALSKRLLNFLS